MIMEEQLRWRRMERERQEMLGFKEQRQAQLQLGLQFLCFPGFHVKVYSFTELSDFAYDSCIRYGKAQLLEEEARHAREDAEIEEHERRKREFEDGVARKREEQEAQKRQVPL